MEGEGEGEKQSNDQLLYHEPLVLVEACTHLIDG